MTNITGGQSVGITPESTPTCTSGGLSAGQVCYVNYNSANGFYDTNNILPMSSTAVGACASPYTTLNEIAPNCVAAIRFNLPASSLAAGASIPKLCSPSTFQYLRLRPLRYGVQLPVRDRQR